MTIRVLIADDSSFQRKVISQMLSENDEIDVVGLARDGIETLEMIETTNPDVLLLDLVMPKMDGLTAFRKILKTSKVPTIIFSVLNPKTLDTSVKALLMGAFDYIIKPGGVWKIELPKFKDQLISKVILASRIKNRTFISKPKPAGTKEKQITEKLIKIAKNDRKVKISEKNVQSRFPFNIIVIGASVGGPKTLRLILDNMPKDLLSPILIVQHLNEDFMSQFAQSLNDYTLLPVKIGRKGEIIEPGVVYIAPGGKHMQVTLKNNIPIIDVYKGDPINFCIPSADPLFISVSKIFKEQAMGIILTGLGNDGVAGLKAIKNAKGTTIAESKETSVVYGMPKVAAETDAAQIIIPNYQVKNKIIRFSKRIIRNK